LIRKCKYTQNYLDCEKLVLFLEHLTLKPLFFLTFAWKK
jgi:hypothetical protein